MNCLDWNQELDWILHAPRLPPDSIRLSPVMMFSDGACCSTALQHEPHDVALDWNQHPRRHLELRRDRPRSPCVCVLPPRTLQSVPLDRSAQQEQQATIAYASD